MRHFFGRPHPWLMQALGGLIALIVIIPIGVYVWLNVVNANNVQAVPAPLAPPVAVPTGGVQRTPAPTVLSGSGSGSGGQTSGSGHSYTVMMQPTGSGTYVFSPSKLTIHAGDTVHWVDKDTTPHNIVGLGSAASLINRTAVNANPYAVTFGKAGTYHYECQVHLPSMVAVITVLSGSSPSSGGSTGSTGSTNSGGGSTVTVMMQPTGSGTYEFNPSKVTIHAGDTVHWVDKDTTPHNIVGLGNATSLIKRTAINADPYSVKFTAKGTYHYECQIHLPNMVGQVIVT